MKSAVLARASGAARVVGFSIWHLREKTARPFYSDRRTRPPTMAGTSSGRTSACCARRRRRRRESVPARGRRRRARSTACGARSGRRRSRCINPGAAWPNKRWPAERFGEVAAFLRERARAAAGRAVGAGRRSARAARSSPRRAARRARRRRPRCADLVALARAAALMVSGDTGPLHIATAVGTPIVASSGRPIPSATARGRRRTWSVSRYDGCGCHYERRCHRAGVVPRRARRRRGHRGHSAAPGRASPNWTRRDGT